MGFFKNIVAPIAKVAAVVYTPVVGVVTAIPAVTKKLENVPLVGTVSKGMNVVTGAGETAANIAGGEKVNVAGQLGDWGKSVAVIGATVYGGPLIGVGNAGYAAAGIGADKLLSSGVNRDSVLAAGGAAAASYLGVDPSTLQDYSSYFQQQNRVPASYLPQPGSSNVDTFGADPAAYALPSSKAGWIIGGVFLVIAVIIVIFKKR